MPDNIPHPIDKPDWSLVDELASDYLHNLHETHPDSQGDLQIGIFEAVMEAMYGTKVWEYINAHCEDACNDDE